MLARLCRFCGRRTKETDLRPLNLNDKKNLNLLFGVDVGSDKPEQHPKKLCKKCHINLSRLIKDPSRRENYSIFNFLEVKRQTRSEDACSGDCTVCYEGSRRNSTPTVGSSGVQRGRPSSRSPLSSICSHCNTPVMSLLSHQCAKQTDTVEYMAERAIKSGISEPLVAAILRKTQTEPVDSLKNIHGKRTTIPVKKETVSEEDLLEVKVKSGRKSHLPERAMKPVISLLKRKNLITPSSHKLKAIKQDRCGDLFTEETFQMERGKKKNREMYEETVAYCTDRLELVRRCKEKNNITTPNKQMKVKLGTDHGRGYLKVTLQIMDIAENSVRHTLILAATPAVETFHNLHVITG